MPENKFYVYVYLDTRKPGKYQYGEYCFDYEPFYVGKGWGRRYRQHLTEAKNYNKNKKYYNNYKVRKINKIILETGNEPLIIKIKENLLEDESLILEKELIKIINKNNKVLTNLNDGGMGCGNELKSNEICHKLCNYIQKNGKAPKVNSFLNRWLSNKRRSFKNTGTYILYESDINIAKSYGLKDIFNDNYDFLEIISNKKTIELCEWITLNNKTPNRYSNDLLEKNMSNLFHYRKRALNKNNYKIYESDKTIIDSYCFMKYFDYFNNELNSNNICRKLCEWIKLNNKMISHKTKDEEEKILYRWWHYKRNNRKKGVFYKSDQEIAESYGLMDLFNIKSLEIISNKNVEKICQWIKKNNKNPSLTSSNKEEKRLSGILHRRRQVLKRTHHGIFYESDQKIVESYGFKDLFEIKS